MQGETEIKLTRGRAADQSHGVVDENIKLSRFAGEERVAATSTRGLDPVISSKRQLFVVGFLC